MNELENTIAYHFKDGSLLKMALTAPACKMDTPGIEDNQRLEFLGDAVIGVLIAEEVYRLRPKDTEGALTERRAAIVSGESLAAVGERIGLRRLLKLNSGAKEPPKNAKVFADAVEAILGAVWLDGGYEAARGVLNALGLDMNAVVKPWNNNPKGYLQMLAATFPKRPLPKYEIVSREGPPHAPVFDVRVTVADLGAGEGKASSIRHAEMLAAADLLEKSAKGK